MSVLNKLKSIFKKQTVEDSIDSKLEDYKDGISHGIESVRAYLATGKPQALKELFITEMAEYYKLKDTNCFLNGYYKVIREQILFVEINPDFMKVVNSDLYGKEATAIEVPFTCGTKYVSSINKSVKTNLRSIK